MELGTPSASRGAGAPSRGDLIQPMLGSRGHRGSRIPPLSAGGAPESTGAWGYSTAPFSSHWKRRKPALSSALNEGLLSTATFVVIVLYPIDEAYRWIASKHDPDSPCPLNSGAKAYPKKHRGGEPTRVTTPTGREDLQMINLVAAPYSQR